MKAEIHPKYTHTAKVVCSTCNTTFVTGSTLEELQTEVCSNCHPFYTGKQNIVDTAGRVDRYKKRAEKSGSIERPLRSRRIKRQTKEAKRAPKAEREK